ncbi:RecQ family ATP-dependent DNA helicase [Candidatus Woesebacteria bacterium]|nr:RecQ family ATP-dependent DNA helicase [Candidatus Woesebacteria bacterium]MCD8527480.1 RecQ family ATP-dependent DNA helicase [Candidatus Woesebacteria bacterium]
MTLLNQKKTTILHSLQRNTTRFVYLSPEQLLSATQAELLKIPLSHICIDEAHCISEWGHDFRPEYQKIGTFLTAYTRFHDRPVLSAFTATAHATVKKDILQFFPLQNPQQFSLPYWRENIDYCVREIISEAQKRRAWLEILTWWQENELAKCLVYVPTRIDAEFYADWARQRGFSAQAFHAGLSLAKRKALLAKFQTTPMSILIATTAFGMGIDIPDIRVVVHLSPPITLSAYAQESGRAGRDGQRSWCFLLFRGEDLHQNLTLFFSPNKQRHRHQKKEAHLVYRWARESACLARSLRMYFETEQKDTQKIIGCRCSRCQRVTSTTPLALFCPRAPSTQT